MAWYREYINNENLGKFEQKKFAMRVKIRSGNEQGGLKFGLSGKVI